MAYIVADNIFSPLGETSEENFRQLRGMQSGIRKHENKEFSEQPFYAALFEDSVFDSGNDHTRFEQMLIRSISAALKNSGVDTSDTGTALIISTTKGNISLLETEDDSPELHQRIALTTSAKKIANRPPPMQSFPITTFGYTISTPHDGDLWTRAAGRSLSLAARSASSRTAASSK